MLISEKSTGPGQRSAASAASAARAARAAEAAGMAQTELALALLKAEYARLVAAARASVTAARAGAADPLVYVMAELSRHSGLPPLGSTVPAVLADAGTAMTLAGRAARPRVMAAS
jgi:hypothetical protein